MSRSISGNAETRPTVKPSDDTPRSATTQFPCQSLDLHQVEDSLFYREFLVLQEQINVPFLEFNQWIRQHGKGDRGNLSSAPGSDHAQYGHPLLLMLLSLVAAPLPIVGRIARLIR